MSDFDQPVILLGESNFKQQLGVLDSCQEAPLYRVDY